MKKILSVVLSGILILSLVACGNSSTNYSSGRSRSDKNLAVAPMETVATDDMNLSKEYMDSEGYYTDSFANTAYEEEYYGNDSSGNEVNVTTQMLIKRKYMTIETLTFDDTVRAINNAVSSNGGFVESSNLTGTENNHNRCITYCFRVPASQYEACNKILNESENIISMNESTDDITSEYIDIEARLVALRTEYDTLINLLEQATDLDTIIILQNELADVRYSIEYYEGNKRLYDNLVSYSTITVTINEIQEIVEEIEEEPEEPTFKDRINDAFNNMKKETREEYENFVVEIVENLPYVIAKTVVFLIALIVIIVVVVKTIRKKKAQRLVEKKSFEAHVKETNSKNEVCNTESNKSEGNSRTENNGGNK